MLTTTINAIEWFFVQQHTEAMLTSHLLHQRHQQHVMVDSQVTLLEDWCQLKLVRCYLVMTGLTRNSQLECLDFQVLHESLYTIRDGSEIVVVHLLVLGTLVSHQGTTSEHQVGTCRIQALINQEVLLLPTQIYLNLSYIVVEVLTYIGCCLVNSMQRTKQWCFIVERLTSIGNKDSWDTECIVDNEYRRCWIPGRIATSLEGITDTAIREA